MAAGTGAIETSFSCRVRDRQVPGTSRSQRRAPPPGQLPPLARSVDGVAIAVERGTPLAEVLRAQAVDVREAGRRQLLEFAGRRDIAMMIPVVFLVLPATLLFALFPGSPACSP